jgi:hypothetical protein
MTSRVLARHVALAGAAIVLLTGCFRLESTFDISDDGTADVEVVTAFDLGQLGQLAELFGQDASELEDLSGEDLLQEFAEGTDPCADLAGSISDLEVTTTEIDDGDVRGVGCTIEDVPIDELSALGDGTQLAITQTDEATTFELQLTGVGDLTGSTEEIPLPGLEIDDLIEVRFSATAPGSLEEENATSTSGATATWVVTADAEFVQGDTAVMTASWGPDDGSGSGWLIVLIVALVVIGLLVVLGLVLLPRLRPAPDELAGGGEAEPPFPPTGDAATGAEGPGPLPPAPPVPTDDAASGPPSGPPAAPGAPGPDMLPPAPPAPDDDGPHGGALPPPTPPT